MGRYVILKPGAEWVVTGATLTPEGDGLPIGRTPIGTYFTF
jgi:hypothetical protein